MKKIIVVALVATVGLAMVACGGKKGAEYEPKGKKFSNSADSVSYALGLYVGQNIAQSKDYYDSSMAGEFQESKFLQGVRAAMKGKPGWTQEATMEYLQFYFQNILPEKQAVAAEKKKEEAVKFMEKIAETKGVQSIEVATPTPTDSTKTTTLYYEIEAAGNDMRATMADQVEVKYKGSKTDGEVFDQTPHGEEETLTLSMGGVIKGFSEGLKLIGEGGKIKLWIPADLGYGEGGPDPNMPLVFELEIVKIIPAAVEAPAETPVQ